MTWNVTLVLPETADDVTVNVNIPTSGGEALMSFIDAQYDSFGRNFMCMESRSLAVSMTSNVSNSQRTSMVIDLGKVANVGKN